MLVQTNSFRVFFNNKKKKNTVAIGYNNFEITFLNTAFMIILEMCK